jgi:hypothetical protein
MSLPRSDSLESISTVLTCTSEEFQVFYDNSNLDTEVLVQDALNTIIPLNKEKLREADKRYRLHDLLSAMLLHAPNPLGKRYVAVCLHVAHKKGEDGVVNAAKAWLDNLFLPSPSLFLLISSNSRCMMIQCWQYQKLEKLNPLAARLPPST